MPSLGVSPPAEATTQDHIHLCYANDGLTGASQSLDGSGGPIWVFKVQERIPHYEAHMSFERTWRGYSAAHRELIGNSPVIFSDFQFKIRCTPELYDRLAQMFGYYVLFVDSRHCADDVDHTPYLRKMFMADFSPIDQLTPTLGYYVVQILLKDSDTVGVVT